jgi:hypothetical protein
MRIMLIALFALATLPALAQNGERYDNPRFGYSVSVPPGFVGQGESDNGDGQAFALPGRAITLNVWGGWLSDFDSEVASRIAQDAADGWNQTYQAVTPRWASWSATAGGQILYQRLIALCDGQSYAAFRVEYGPRDRAEMDPVVEQLVASLRSDAC